MWFRRAISKLRYWYCERFHLELYGTERAVYVNCLDAKLFSATDSARTYLATLRVVFPSVELYNQKLFWLNHHLSSDLPIPNDWCRYDYRETLLANFLIDSKGRHLDPVSAFVAFKQNALLFLQRLDSLPPSTTGTAGHNARVLVPFRQHLLEVFRALISYTHHE